MDERLCALVLAVKRRSAAADGLKYFYFVAQG